MYNEQYVIVPAHVRLGTSRDRKSRVRASVVPMVPDLDPIHLARAFSSEQYGADNKFREEYLVANAPPNSRPYKIDTFIVVYSFR
jgi:hypothetical protein